MNDRISLSRALMDRLVRVSRRTTLKPESIARKAIAERVAYLEWESRVGFERSGVSGKDKNVNG
jgi:predicted transcriptional regulator